MAQYLSGAETTQRESLLDTISIRYPAETPLIRTLPHTSINNRITEYSIDRPFAGLSTVRDPTNPHANTREEGAAWSVDSTDYPVRLKAIAEINHFSAQVSNTDRTTILAGTSDTFDYRAHQKFVKLLNNIETVLMYGSGSPETSGSPGGGDERRCQGLIFWSAWTGVERVHGTPNATITDPYGVSIPSDYYSVFYNAAGANLSRQMLYNKILANFNRAGGRVPGLLFHVGAKVKTLIADFGVRPDGSAVNDRNIEATSAMTYDDLDFIRTPLGVVGFRTNRYLDIEGDTFSIDNTGAAYTPGSPSPAGSVAAITAQADETIIGYEPGQVAIGWLRPPQYEMVPTNGDFTQFATVAEFTLLVRNPLSVVGACNVLA